MQQQGAAEDNAKKSGDKRESGEKVEAKSAEISLTSEREEKHSANKKKGPMAKFPMWLTAILLAVFASIMALPLLTLDFAQL